MRKILGLTAALVSLCIAVVVLAQNDQNTDDPLSTDPNCAPATLAQQQDAFAALLTLDFEADPEAARENLFKLGKFYQELALNCGYQPTEQEVDALIQTALQVADVADILAANTVGDDVQAILTQLAGVQGDPFNGQLLYNGIEPVLGNTTLGCAGCHQGEVAPLTEGTYTRVTDVRLQQPELSGYTVEQYLVESIVRPNDYIAPAYTEGLMPMNYGSQLTLQQMADLIAYTQSQDQLLDE